MKLLEQERGITMTDNLAGATRRFQLVMSGKMAKILSDGIYSNKILAIVRELSANAYDSHVANGNPDEPFDIWLPDCYAGNTFYIRDYGTGMSPETIFDLYTHYGESDKDESNESIGALGLGSKCFFCYATRSATVTSWYGGMEYVYQCFLASDGIPSITLLTERPSSEPTGVKVLIKTNREDELEFVRCVQKVFKHFRVKPNIKGGKIVDVSDEKYSLRGTDWAVVEKNNYGCRAIMGQMVYPINYPDSAALSINERAVLSSPVDLFFEIGELDVEVNREGLSFDNRTKMHIKAKLNSVLSEINKMIEDKIAKAKNLWEARLAYCDIMNSMHNIKNMIACDKVKYGNKNLFNTYLTVSCHDLAKADQLTSHRYSYRKGWYSQSGKVQISETSLIELTHKIIFVEDDLDRGAKSRCQERIRGKEDEYLYLLKFPDDAAKAKFMEFVGIDETYFVKASSLPKKVAAQKSGRSNKTDVVKFDVNSSSHLKHSFWQNDSVDVSASSGFYVETHIYDIMYDGHKYEPLDMCHLIRALDEHKIKAPTIYGVNKANIAKFKKSKNWQDFIAWALDKLKSVAYTNNVEQLESNSREYHQCFDTNTRYSDNYRLSLESLMKIQRGLDSSHLIADFVAKAKLASRSVNNLVKYNDLLAVLRTFKITLENKKVAVVRFELKKLEDQIYATYPMLNCVQTVYNDISSTTLKAIMDYILLVDSK